jgi:HlyD family secretion protein
MKNNKLLRYLIIATVVLVAFLLIGKKAGWFGDSDTIKVTTEITKSRSIVETITANGKIQPETEVKISPDVSGEIIDLFVMEGDEVKEGKLLLKIKEDIYISYLDRSKASLNSAKSNLANSKARLVQTEASFNQAQLSYKRSKKLYDQDAISDSEYENAEASYEMSKADVKAAEESVNSAKYAVKSAEASLKEARENLTKTSIYAPIDGTISRLNIEKGERVVGTVQMAGTELLRIADLNVMEVKVEVNENDIVRVNLDDTALIEVDAYLKQKFKGVVTEIANSANVTGMSTDQVTNFDVKIRILTESYHHLIGSDNRYPFRPGMSATVDIQTQYEDGILTVPIQAVTTRVDTANVDFDQSLPEDEKKSDKDKLLEVVFVYMDGKVLQKEVKTGIQDDNYIQILEGLEENEEIVIAPYSAISKKLENEKIVEKVNKDELFSGDK